MHSERCVPFRDTPERVAAWSRFLQLTPRGPNVPPCEPPILIEGDPLPVRLSRARAKMSAEKASR